MVQDAPIAWVNRNYYSWVLLGLIVPSVIEGMVTVTWLGALKGLLWGGLLRMFLVHHSSWTIGSVAHIYGKTPFFSHDKSKNNLWIALPTLGEGWHNNHHAFPNSAFHGLQWWQFDVTGWVIRVMQLLGLAWEVKRPTLAMMEAKKRRSILGES
jgi:stearoyl-CoA desaturase (Delta-9 desaturase)